MDTKMIGAVMVLGLVSSSTFAATSYETAPVVESRAIYELGSRSGEIRTSSGSMSVGTWPILKPAAVVSQ